MSEKQKKMTRREKALLRTKNKLSSPWATAISIVIAVVWTIPTVGLLVTSFRQNRVAISQSGWWVSLLPSHWSDFGLGNYKTVLSGSYSLGSYLINSFVITIPGVLIPISLALLAAYAFAWCDFPGKNILFIAVFSMQVVPVQIAMIPLLTQYVNWGINNTFWVIWLTHTIFGLPLAIFMLHNFMCEIPRELVEAARVDGAGDVKIFLKVVLPLMVPAVASFAIFQFLWVWNDLLVALAFTGNTVSTAPLTARLSDMVGTRGTAWYLLAPGAFVAMLVPVAVFLFLQRYFVRGMLAGAVKG